MDFLRHWIHVLVCKVNEPFLSLSELVCLLYTNPGICIYTKFSALIKVNHRESSNISHGHFQGYPTWRTAMAHLLIRFHMVVKGGMLHWLFKKRLIIYRYNALPVKKTLLQIISVLILWIPHLATSPTHKQMVQAADLIQFLKIDYAWCLNYFILTLHKKFAGVSRNTIDHKQKGVCVVEGPQRSATNVTQIFQPSEHYAAFEGKLELLPMP